MNAATDTTSDKSTSTAADPAGAQLAAARQATMAAMLDADDGGESLARHIIMYDPDLPSEQLFSAGETVSRAVLAPIPWPAGFVPTTVPTPPPPAAGGPLPKADVLVVTWTVAEARALADVLTPGVPSTSWQSYRHHYSDVYEPLIRNGAPARQLQRLGCYQLTEIGGRRVLCMKSDLHLSQDGPKLPVRKLWAQIITESGASQVITTGTAGGIGADTSLGDVIVASTVQFDCKRTFAHADFAHASYTDRYPTAASAQRREFAQHTLLPVNAVQLPAGTAAPRIRLRDEHSPAQVLTTDFFAFDDTTDSYGLRTANPHALAVEMGDAVLGLVAAEDLPKPPAWAIVRNASDPQMDGSLPLKDQAAQAANIYEKYGYWTTVGSAIATWALIAA